jgi:D-alanyl-D-alanine carboxypeptidase (penicillin-binding protein 5/6)
MNERAASLGMDNTHFEDCCGLTESSNHYTTAHDIAIMSRELITKYPAILNYSSIWMEDITHVTRQGSSPFTLTNTNKLIRSYEGCVGLKTGSTSLAKYCLSAVAKRNGITLIAVVMAAPDYKVRFKDAAAMLNYGFSKCSLYVEEEPPELPEIQVKKGLQDTVSLEYGDTFEYLRTDGVTVETPQRELTLPDEVQAPIRKGDTAGTLTYTWQGTELGSVPVLYAETVEKAGFGDCIRMAWMEYLL